jgi:hypothetical protein
MMLIRYITQIVLSNAKTNQMVCYEKLILEIDDLIIDSLDRSLLSFFGWLGSNRAKPYESINSTNTWPVLLQTIHVY